MGRRTPIFFLASILINGAHGLSDFVRFENDAGDIVKAKQPVLAQRDGRFIRFDTSDTEIELELGVSVPFLKIPIHASTAAEHTHTKDHRLTINPAGILIGVTILFTSFLLVPWVLPSSGHHTRKDDHTLGNGGRSENGGPSALLLEIENLLKTIKLDPRTCPQKMLCVVGQKVTSVMPGVFDGMLPMDVLAKKFDIVKVIMNGSCDDVYKDCRLNGKSLITLTHMLGIM